MKFSLFKYSLFFALILKLHSQNINYPLQNYSTKDYGKNRSSQNLCVVQDKNGFIYFGNANGVLQYDNLNWRFIPVKTGAYVTSLAVDSTGTIFVGSQKEFGYLQTTKNGNLTYQSLLSKIDASEMNFGTIVKTSANQNEVFFQCEEKVFVFRKDSTFKILKPSTTFHTSFVVNNNFYVRERQKGLFILKNNKLQVIEGTVLFKDLGIFSMLPFDKRGTILLVTMEAGLWKLNPNSSDSKTILTPILSNKQVFLLNALLYGGTKLSNGNFALNSLNEGVIITDTAGNVISIINKSNGLRVNDVKNIIQDNQQNLWLALNNGISKVVFDSHLSYYSEENGLNGTVHDVIRFNNVIYTATSAGLFYRSAIDSNEKFNAMPEIKNRTWRISKYQNTLIIGGDEGVFEIKDRKTRKILNVPCRSLEFDSLNSIWVLGNSNGVFLFDNNWKYLRQIKEVNSEIVSIKLIRSKSDNSKSIIYAGTALQGIFKIDLNTDLSENLEWLGLPGNLSNECVYPFFYNNNIVFAASTGIYEYNQKNGFQLTPLINGLTFEQNTSGIIQSKSNLWLCLDNRPVLFKSENSNPIEKPFFPIDKGQIHCMYEDSSICWIGTDDGLVRYDIDKKRNLDASFPIYIRSVTIGKDSVHYSGNGYQNNLQNIVAKFDYNYNSIIFQYSGLFYENGSNLLYSFKLSGQDTSWSKWSNETKSVFTNLFEGKYVYYVKAKNIYGTESTVASYEFEIKAPLYRSWWAYTGYTLVFGFSIYSLIKFRTRKLIKEKTALENNVKARTAEVVEQKHLIEEKHKEITDSINYAERIQRSFLATQTHLNENLNDYFILFKPKDVVSGDFYWSATLNNGNFALVTADSTGHGVPGAIMSLLNITSLEKAIETQTAPAEILNATRKTIIERLKKDGSEFGGKDGMDASLIVYDFKNKKLVVAAAHNPVWIVRGTETIEIKPDKMPVGKHDRDSVSFTQQEIELQKGDIVYSLTDGFPDQFGGPLGKKFMSKNLRALLATNSHLPMQQQKKLLEKTFTEWVNDLEQVDDVTII
ncbi:MAG: SpoIIE family protein phosphatase, partial [Sphingobacteriaceae bacterium]